MMCSSWKISVFGLVALMLAFGLSGARAGIIPGVDADGDAIGDPDGNHDNDDRVVRHPGRATITVNVVSSVDNGGAVVRSAGVHDITAPLRATEKLDSLTFTYILSADEAGNKGSVEILLPAGWRGAFATDNAQTSGDGRETRDWAAPPIIGSASPKTEITSSKLKAIIDQEGGAADNSTIIFTYLNVTVPKRAGIYDFEVRSNLVKTNFHTNYLNPDETGNEAIADDANSSGLSDDGRDYQIRVYGIPSGKGKIELSRSSGTFHKGGDEVDKAYKNSLLVTHKEDLGTLLLKFTAPGTMYKGSKVQITIPEGWTALQSYNGGAADPGEVNVRSGPVKVLVSGDNDRVMTATTTANMEADRSFTIAYMKVTSPGNHEMPTPVQTYTFETVTASVLEDTDDARTAIEALSEIPSFDAEVAASVGTDVFPGENPGEEPVVTVTARHGVGTLVMTKADDTDPLKYAMSGEEVGELQFTFGGMPDTAKTGSQIGMAKGGQVRIEFDSAWSPPFDATRTGDERLGAVFIADDQPASLKSENGVITATLTQDLDGDTDSFTFTYFVKTVPTVQKTYEFKTSSKSHAQAPFAPLGAMPSVDVTAPHGSGEIVLKSGGQTLRRTAKGRKLGDLQFTYKTAGWMAKDAILQIAIPDKWTNVRPDNSNNVREPGEVVLSGSAKANLELNSTNRTIRAKAAEPWREGATVIVTYRNITAPGGDDAKGSYLFETRALSFPTAGVDTSIDLDGALLESSPSVGVDQTPDGSGTITLSKGGANFTGATAGDAIGDLVFTYAVQGSMEANSQVEIEIPEAWTEPDYDDGDADAQDTGEVVFGGAGGGSLSISGYVVTVSTSTDLLDGDTFAVTYKNITAPEAGDYDFHVKSTSTPGGEPTALDNSPLKVTIGAVDPGAVTASVSSAEPGADLGNLDITYKAVARLDAGAVIKIVIPAGWKSAFPASGADDDRPGAVSVSDNAVLSFDGAYTLIATTNTVLEDGDTVILTYGTITAPSVQKVYSFLASFSAGGDDPEVSIPGPSVVVRTVPTALTLSTSANNFFVGESITVTVESDAQAPVGGLEVALATDPAGSGMFSMTEGGEAITSVTIEDSAESMSAMVYYTNDTASAVMLTATAGELTADPASVTVKSTISNLRVNGMEEPDPVTGDGEIIVSATGKDGEAEATVTQMIMDADGNQIPVSVVSTKGLDDDPDAENVPEGDAAYSRDIDLGEANEGMGLEDGMYTVTVSIAGESASIQIEVVNDRTLPVLSEASALPAVVADGDQVVLRVVVTSANDISSVTADVSALDSTRTEPIVFTEQPDVEGVYIRLFTISTDNTNDQDGVVMVTFTATDRLGTAGESDPVSITLRNDVTAPTLSMASAMPSPAANDAVITISVSSESGLTVTANASAIGGGMVTLSEPMMAANGNGNGMNGMDANGNGGNGMNGMDANGNGGNGMNGIAANGNGNGMDANGMTNGMGANGMAANGNGNGMDANGMTNGMGANGMDANGNGNGMDANGNVMYTGMATVTDAADGEQMITITATDASGNSSPATVSVTVDNTGPALTMQSADLAMETNGPMVTISVSTESGATVTANASAIGGDAMESLPEGMDENMMGTGMYSTTVPVADDTPDGEHMVSISATDELGNASDEVTVPVTVDTTAPTLADAAITPDWALNGDPVTISVSTESGATVMADASAIGGDAALELAEGMDDDMMGTGMYSSAPVTVTDAEGGVQMVSISASDALGNTSEAVSASVSIHVVTSASFSPADVSTGDTVTVSAMGTAGLTATYNVFDAEATNIVTDGMLTESADAAGSYSGSFDVVVDAHPTGTYWVSVNVGQATMGAEGALTIDHLAQFDLMIGAGIHLIHVPLDVTHIDGVAGTIDTVGNLYDALGDAVKFIISLGADGSWNSYLGDSSAGSVADAAIGDDTGLVAVMNSAASLRLAGNALGTGGAATITLGAGNNLVGVPLDGDLLSMISDALSPLVSAVVVSNEAGNGFNTIVQKDDPGDGAIMGGVGYIVQASAAASIPVIGAAWDNSGMMEDAGATVAMNGGAAANGNGASTAPSIGFQTPVLHVQGKLIDQVGMMSREGLNVSVKNLSSGTVLGHTTATDDYSMTFVKLDSSAAKVGDVLEIKADSANPLLGIRPVQHVVTAEDVLDSRISLPDLVTYEIPAQTELLANYPNPFNPETWIPFRLAEDASVSLTIYGASGSLVRSIDIGFTPAAVYQGRSEAIYWDGRNDFGEQVSSGIYFYHLNAGDFSATRKMVIVK